MSTEISTTVSQQRGLALATFEDAFRFSELVAKSDFAPKDFRGKPEACLLAIQHGAELGLSPMQSLQSIAVVNGRPTIYGDAACALVMASPVCEYVSETLDGEGENMMATCKAKRRGSPSVTVSTFSVADAKKAGLWGKGGPWTQYPKRMLQMRARGFALRDAFADVLRTDLDRRRAAVRTGHQVRVVDRGPLDQEAGPFRQRGPDRHSGVDRGLAGADRYLVSGLQAEAGCVRARDFEALGRDQESEGRAGLDCRVGPEVAVGAEQELAFL